MILIPSFFLHFSAEYVDVVDYFLTTGKVGYDFRDEHQRSLLHLAIMNNRDRVLEHLLTQVFSPTFVPDIYKSFRFVVNQ